MRFQQDEVAQRLMLKSLEKNGDQYFQYMIARRWKLPHEFDVQRIIQTHEPTMAEILREEMWELKIQLAQLQVSKEQPKTYFVESI